MNKPNRKDLRKLKSLLSKIEKIELQFDSLTQETKSFLEEEFVKGTTKGHLYNFDRNITETIREIVLPKK